MFDTTPVSDWYASNAAARRGYTLPGERWVMGCSRGCSPQIMTFVERNWEDTDNRFITINVKGWSERHIDRLARDWIGHGVAPCQDGSRGVATGVKFPRTPDESKAAIRFIRAEARARRVVICVPDDRIS